MGAYVYHDSVTPDIRTLQPVSPIRVDVYKEILQNHLLNVPECEDSCFYRTCFPDSWHDALNRKMYRL